MRGLIISKLKLPYLMLMSYIILGLSLQFFEVSGFQALPSSLYGGDYYYQMGSVNHILSGGNPFESSSMIGGIPGYLPLYGILCAGFCKLFGLDAFNGMIYFSLVIFVVSSAIWFNTFKKIFKNEWVSVIGVVLANGISIYPILKYTEFTRQIMIPLFILALYLTFTSKKPLNYAFLGMIYGLLAISHTVAFVGATLTIATFIIYELYKKYNSDKIKGIKSYLIENWKNLSTFGIFGASISMLYWYKPIFVYKLSSFYDRTHMDTLDVGDQSIQLAFVKNSFFNYFLNFNSPIGTFTSLLVIYGTLSLVFKRNSDEYSKNFIKLFGLSSVIATFCYFITEPLLKMNFIPTYMSSFYITSAILLISLYSISLIYETLKNKINNRLNNDSNLHKNRYMIFGVIFILLTTNTLYSFVEKPNNDQWLHLAYLEIPECYNSLENYLEKNTDENDVILSSKMLSSVVNSVSGRKVMVNHWAQQNDPYMDLSQRDIDAAIIFYGNDTPKKLELIKKYNVSYLYWDYYWINLEYGIDKNGNIANIRDPLLAYSNEDVKNKLEENTVSFIERNTWVNPGVRSENVRKFDLIIISPENYPESNKTLDLSLNFYLNRLKSPENYRNSIKPWKEDLNPYLEEVWNYSIDGQEIAVLYKIQVE
ncbi:hypothetical protein [Methanococcus maripaludis]|uniref:Glycosyltransferase RgtA/B/C/D-like domain-containing protein n=1 Tax=Methanococcus maripaludis TaxID=39152 RepID=A0A7J9PQD0_METMI|nr:hypothetical protein [Methanococcus maripaludis]MBA2864906.1 hypothetical protein [Methanococcus maripaludis]